VTIVELAVKAAKECPEVLPRVPGWMDMAKGLRRR
jgi:hypothetical protein